MMKAYQDVAELHASMSNNDYREGENVFSKEDWLHMTVVNEQGTELRRSTVPRNQLLNALLSSVKPLAVNPPPPTSLLTTHHLHSRKQVPACPFCA
jgi:hypothetical protein